MYLHGLKALLLKKEIKTTFRSAKALTGPIVLANSVQTDATQCMATVTTKRQKKVYPFRDTCAKFHKRPSVVKFF